MRRQAGQSMAEFAAGSSVLALLLLGSLALGGFQESDRRLVLSARQAAWQQSWTPQHTDAAMRGELALIRERDAKARSLH